MRGDVLLQSVRSDLCLVYSAAMLLVHHGLPVGDRASARRMFGAARAMAGRAPPLSLDAAALVVGCALGVPARWRFFPAPYAACTWLARTWRTRGPALLAFGAEHTRTGQRCGHVVVVVGATDDALALADPLGRARDAPNATLPIAPLRRHPRTPVDGACYAVVRARVAAVLTVDVDD